MFPAFLSFPSFQHLKIQKDAHASLFFGHLNVPCISEFSEFSTFKNTKHLQSQIQNIEICYLSQNLSKTVDNNYFSGSIFQFLKTDK